MEKILIIDDEANIRDLLSKILHLEGFNVDSVESAKEGLELIGKEPYAVLITDVKLPDANGVDLVKSIKKDNPNIEIIVITAYGNIQDGVNAMRNGAFDYIVKGNDDDKLPLIVKRAFDKALLHKKVLDLEERIDSKFAFENIIGKSKKISEAMEYAKKVAPADTTVLLLGETGTGKELFAQAIHSASRRKNNKFTAVNCSAIPKDLQESEFFGYKKGAFTGAVSDKKGYFEEANAGTIFLDEIGDMNYETQAKLLRVIETKTYTRVGDSKEQHLDIRIIAATNQDLNESIKEGTFREDLFYRLNVFTIHLPALRERIEDLDMLVKFFVEYYARKLKKDIPIVSKDFIGTLKTYKFKGNTRELKNIIERALILSQSNTLTVDLLSEENSVGENAEINKKTTLEEVEKNHIIKILKENEGNRTRAAKALGIGTVTLYRKLKEYGIE
jgi:DNA-binding NtrC family response regulator